MELVPRDQEILLGFLKVRGENNNTLTMVAVMMMIKSPRGGLKGNTSSYGVGLKGRK